MINYASLALSLGTITIVLLIAALVVGVMLMAMKAHKLRLRDKANKQHYITDYLMLEVKEKDTGAVIWKSVPWQPKIKIPAPPSDVIDIGKRGKKVVEAHLINPPGKDGLAEVVWVRDKGYFAETVLEDTKETFAESFKEFSVVDRDTIVNQFKKSVHKAQDLKSLIFNNLPMILLTMFLIMLLIFSGDVFAGIRGYQETNRQMTQDLMRLKIEGCGGSVSQTVPSSSATQTIPGSPG